MKKISAIILAAFALASCIKEVPVQQEVKKPSSAEVESNIVQGAIIVKVTEDLAAVLEQADGMLETKSADVNAVLRQFGITKYSRVFDSDPRWVERERREGLHLYYQLEYDPELTKATKAASDIATMPGIQSSEVIYKKKLMYTTTPNDPYFRNEWHLYNSNGYDLNVQKVWTEFTQGDQKVIVNVVDGGIKPDHPDILENLIPGGAGGSKNFVTGNYTITGHFHGTHVGGTIAATTNNGVGVAGIAGGDYALGKKGVQLLCSQVFTDDRSASSFANAIKYGADNGAVISQNSWGYDFDSNRDYQISESEYQDAVRAAQSFPKSAEATAIDYFIKYAGCDNKGNQLPNSPMKGGIVFFSAGNDNIDVGVPAIYESCVAVGAYASTGKKASFSNYGDWVDICAPGQNIYNTSCGDYGTYCNMSGTSMSCPMVSGVAALLVSYRGGTGFTNELLKEALLKAADDKIPSSKIGPMINAYNAMIYKLEPAPDPLPSYTAEGQANNINFTWTVTAKQSGKAPVDGVLLCASKNRTSIASLDPAEIPSDVTAVRVSTADKTIGAQATGSVTGLDFGATYYVAAIPYCTAVYATVGTIKQVQTGQNNPPTVTPEFDPAATNVRASEVKEFRFIVEDPDRHSFRLDFKKANACEEWTLQKESILTVKIPAPQIAQTGRSYTTTITVTDAYGAVTEYPFTYFVLPNNPPVVGKKFDNIVTNLGAKKVTIPLDDKFTDSDGDDLEYTVTSSTAAIARASIVSGNGVEVVFGTTSGEAKLTVTARDGRGEEAKQTFRILLRVQGESVSVYPTQVIDNLTIGTGAILTDTHVEIYSQSGALVFTFDDQTSAFRPAEIDLSGLAPGKYQVRVTFGGETYVKTIVKL